jgi:2-amino-4-hydroxy-6-hydroxymethyldihydropteridine diphosphokinase
VTAVLSLGTNLGDRVARLRCGLEVINQHVPVTAVSPVYETEPVGVTDQPAFLNIVAVVDAADPERVFAAAQAAEETQARLRSRRWGPRSLDVDVIAVGEVATDDPRLTLPHPRAHERAFVLVPWLAVDPTAYLPRRGSVRALLAAMPHQDVRRVSAPMPLP